jgi:hypothetical protein
MFVRRQSQCTGTVPCGHVRVPTKATWERGASPTKMMFRCGANPTKALHIHHDWVPAKCQAAFRTGLRHHVIADVGATAPAAGLPLTATKT